MNTKTIVAIVVLLLTTTFWAGRWSRIPHEVRLEREIAYYQKTYKTQSGWSSGFGSYYLVSVDGGATWIALDPKTKALIGPADPALLAHIDGWAALSRHVDQYGPIGSRPITGDDLAALRGAGFGVTTKPD